MGKAGKLNFPESKSLDRFIVAVGASAGGLEAIHEFFDHMPSNSGFTFVVIQHLSPDYKSLLVELVSKHTHMNVYEASHDTSLQRDSVYIIPNKKLMTIRGHKLQLADKNPDKAPNTAIDTFLFSLAKDKRDKAIAIILSGTGTDGTKGAEAIKEYGGMVIVQDPATAKFDGMPNSAITSGNADYVLSPAKMHIELYNYIAQSHVPGLEASQLNDEALDRLFSLVSAASGQDFKLYKTPTILRRIARRMAALAISEFEEYVQKLNEDNAEVKVLAKDFLIGVTKFFRDKPAFDVLAKDIIPQIVNKKKDGDLLKIWICACSTGEEAYSIAILINEHLKKIGRTLEVKIFATDVDDTSIDIAARNSYSDAVIKEIPSELLATYFIKDGKRYSVIPSIRKQIVFARHNVIKSPPFIKNDLVTCRNMLIYMNTLLQEKVIATFHYSLNRGGFLFLGPSENASSIKEGVTEISSKWKIYQKTGSISYGLHHTYTALTPSLRQVERKPVTRAVEAVKTINDEFHELVLEQFDPVGIFIDQEYNVKETIGSFSKYLTLPKRKLDLNILNLVSKDVSLVLNTAIRKAWKEGKKNTIPRIRTKRDGEEIWMQITVKPPDASLTHGYTLLLFSETKADSYVKDIPVNAPAGSEYQHEYMMELEAELLETKSNLQLAVEEMETTNEELQSSNEELLSANEELQSGNEELQSLNEELHTLNTEHQVKIRELIELNDDLDNYFRSTDIGQIFLDSNLAIRKFNPAAIRMVNLIESDVGRPINHISSNIEDDNFVSDIHSVLASGKVIEKEVKLKAGTNNLMRIMPYLRKDRKLDGVVVSLVDITRISELKNLISGVFNATASAILAFRWIRNNAHKITDFECIAYNNAALHFADKKIEEFTGKISIHSFPDLVKHISFDQFIKVAEGGKPLTTELKTSAEQWFQVMTAKLKDGFIISLTDITDVKKAEQKLRKNYLDLVTAREELKVLNTQLEAKVFERTQKLTESEERFNLISNATNDTIWDWNLVENTIWRSENFTSMFGYERTERNKRIDYWFNKIHPEDRERVKESVYQAINQNKDHWSAEYRFLKADDTYAVILDRASIITDHFGTPHRLVGTIVDITRLIETEQRLKESEVRAREAVEQLMLKKDEFMSIASHELKTPVTSLKGSLQILERMSAKYPMEDSIVNFIGKASRQTDKLTALLNDLMDVTKIQEGKMLLTLEDFDAHAMIRESIDEVLAQAGEHDIILNCEDVLNIRADRARLEQVVNNFITNAIKYSPSAREIIVACSIDKNNFRFSVTDFGIGIPESKQEFLFDRFYRVQESSSQFSGLGLGLYISAEIVKRHNGNIGVDSEPDKGSTFWFTIPIEEPS